MWSLGIGPIVLNKVIKGKGRSEGVSILCGVDCIPSLALEEEEGITFFVAVKLLSQLRSSYLFFPLHQ